MKAPEGSRRVGVGARFVYESWSPGRSLMAPRLDSHLSRVLLDEGLATVEALEEAAQQQLIHGGALDTLLLELDNIDEATLTDALARAWGTPRIDARRLDVSPTDAARWLPERIAVSLAICPFAEDGEALHVVVGAPPDRGLLDEVGTLVKRPLIAHVIPEVRVWDLLHRAYDAVIDERLVSLLRHLDNTTGQTTPKKREPRLVTRPPDLEETHWDVVEALAHLAAQENRAGIADVALRYARQFLPFAAIFGVRHNTAVGWRRSGPADGPQFESVELPVPLGSVLAQVLESPSPLLGKPPITDGNAAFFGWLGRRRPRTALLIPIIVARRPVAVLTADGGVRAQTFDALSDLVAFGARLGVSFEALLRARHRAHPEIFAEKDGAHAETKSPSPAKASVVVDLQSPSTNTPGRAGLATDVAPTSPAQQKDGAGTVRDGTSPFARGYVAPKPKGPSEPHTHSLTMSGDGSWNLVQERKVVGTPPHVDDQHARAPSTPAERVANRVDAQHTAGAVVDESNVPPAEDEMKAFEDVPSSSEIASFEKGPTSTEIASFEGGDTPHPETGADSAATDRDVARVVIGALVNAATSSSPEPESGGPTPAANPPGPTDSKEADDDTVGVTGMYRILPRNSGDVDAAAFSAAMALQQTRAEAVDDVDRVSMGLDALETGGFQNLLEPRQTKTVEETATPWARALKDTIAHGRQGGTATSTDSPVLADDDGWEDVVIDRAYAAALQAIPTTVEMRSRGNERIDENDDDDDDIDADDLDALVLEATGPSSQVTEAESAPIPDVDDDAILPAYPGTLVAVETGGSSTSEKARPDLPPHDDRMSSESTAASTSPREGSVDPAPVAIEPPSSPKELVGMLDSLYADRIQEAKRKIVALGKDAVPALIEAFPGRLLIDPFADDARVERSADLGPLIEVCESLGALGLDVAIPHLDSRFPAHRFAATFLFVVVPDDRAIDVLRPRLHDFEGKVRTLATAGLSHFVAHPKFIQVLTHLRQRLAAPSHEARERAAMLLGNFRDVGAIPTLMRLLEEKGSVSEAAHGALTRITLVDLGPKLKSWEKWWERARTKTRIDWLIDALRHKERDVRFVAATELQEITGQDFGYDCDKQKRDREDAVRRVEAWWESERAAIGM
jgi:hypothetical protein